MTTEADYLNQYDASRFPSPLVTVDSVLFTLHQQALCVLLVERAKQCKKDVGDYPAALLISKTMIQPVPPRCANSLKNGCFAFVAGTNGYLFWA